MFVKINNNEILKVDQILRIEKEVEEIYEETEEYKEWRKANNSIFCFFTGKRYTDKLVKTTYKVNIYTDDLSDDLELEYETSEEQEKEFDRLWDLLKTVKGE